MSYINGIEERVDVPRIQPINTTTIGGGQKVLLSKFRQLKQIVAVGAVCWKQSDFFNDFILGVRRPQLQTLLVYHYIMSDQTLVLDL